MRVNEKVVKSNYKVRAGDVVTVEYPNPVQTFELVPEAMELDVLFEDDSVLVINKPSGLVVHPGNGNYTGTLVHGVAYHFLHGPFPVPHLDNTIPRPGLVHRLDKNTTGVMVLGKTDRAMTHLSNQFYQRTVDRRYTAFAWGDLMEDGTIEGHIGRNRRDRRIQDVYPDGSEGKHAITHYKVLDRLGPLTVVECKLETGRTHQIRVHLKHQRHPLFGDPEYGGNEAVKGAHGGKYLPFLRNCFKILPRQALHARSLAFEHPVTGERLTFTSALPPDMKEILARWYNYLGRELPA